jgi:DNA-binding PadR family transcriptional regulator
MCQDRVGSEIIITHEYISLLLAVRRASVTDALHVLEGKGFIKSERRHVTVRNRAAMEVFARDAYGQPEREYWQLFGTASAVEPSIEPRKILNGLEEQRVSPF